MENDEFNQLICPYCGEFRQTAKGMVSHLTNKHNIQYIPKERVQMRRFYVGSEAAMRSGWAKDTLEEAIAHGKKILREDKTKDSVFIVQVIKVVKRPEPEAIVVDVE